MLLSFVLKVGRKWNQQSKATADVIIYTICSFCNIDAIFLNIEQKDLNANKLRISLLLRNLGNSINKLMKCHYPNIKLQFIYKSPKPLSSFF